MHGNIVAALQMIVFVFLFIGYSYLVLKEIFKARMSDKFEILCLSSILSLLISALTYALLITTVSEIWYNHMILYWFIFFCVSAFILQFVSIFTLKLDKYFEKFDI